MDLNRLREYQFPLIFANRQTPFSPIFFTVGEISTLFIPQKRHFVGAIAYFERTSELLYFLKPSVLSEQLTFTVLYQTAIIYLCIFLLTY